MPKSAADQRVNHAHPTTDAGPVREMRIDAPHRLGDGPAVDYESALNAAEAALQQACEGQENSQVKTVDSITADKFGVANKSIAEQMTAGGNISPADFGLWRAARTQLQQLAELLKTRQGELDHRDAQLQSQAARIEQDRRELQLKLREWQAEVAERTDEFSRRTEALDDRVAALAKLELAEQSRLQSQAGIEQARIAELEQRERRLREWEIALSERTARLELTEQSTEQIADELSEQRQALAVEAELLSRRGAALRQLVAEYLAGLSPTAVEIHSARAEAGIDPAWDAAEEWRGFARELCTLAERRKRLVENERSCVRSLEELFHGREQLAAERSEHAEQVARERRELERERQQLAVAAEQEIAARDAMRQETAARRQALEQFQAELIEVQRSLLTERLEIEELTAGLPGNWSGGRMAAAQLSARKRLAELYQWQFERLAEERGRLENLLSTVPREQAALIKRREELESWLVDRQRELAGMMEQIAVRERELNGIADELQRVEQKHQNELEIARQEIRRLNAELGI